MNNEDLLILLKAPFPVDKLSWRIGQKTNWDRIKKCKINPEKPVKAKMLVYIDSRDVQDRLDEVFGGDWCDDYKEVAGRVVCSITHNGVTKSDGAGDTDFEGEKGGLSDAFKRAGVKWGVGRYLYSASNYNTTVDATDMADWEVVTKNKEYLDMIAQKLTQESSTYHYFLERIKTCDDSEVEGIKNLAGKKVKIEQWPQGWVETFKKHYQERKKDEQSE